MACEEFEVYQHLVVARTARVYLLTHVAEALRKHQLHLRVNVFHTLFYDEIAVLCHAIDAAQLAEQLVQLVALEQTDGLEHGDVCHGAKHIVLGKIEVELAVTTHGEALYLFVHFKILFPEFLCHNLTN